MKHNLKMLLFSLTLVFGITNNAVAMETNKNAENKQSSEKIEGCSSCSDQIPEYEKKYDGGHCEKVTFLFYETSLLSPLKKLLE